MRAIWCVIEHVADTDATILLCGESGKLGLFECARGGTIYLDEIAELSLTLQAKLLHVLQDFCFSRVGGNGSISVNARVIAATNRDLERAMARREFREDLYHRVNVVELRVPPLRERRDEILPLAAEFLARFNERYGRQKELSPETLARLTDYPWSGNVRELENVIRRMVVLADGEGAFAALAAAARETGAPIRRRPRARSTRAWPRSPAAARGRPNGPRSRACSSRCTGIAPRPPGFSGSATRRYSTRSPCAA